MHGGSNEEWRARQSDLKKPVVISGHCTPKSSQRERESSSARRVASAAAAVVFNSGVINCFLGPTMIAVQSEERDRRTRIAFSNL